MKKIVNFVKKNYIYLNITFMLLSIYIIFFPVIEIPIKKIFPNFNSCPYLMMTGKPCPLCGGTRYIRNLPNAFKDITYLFHPFGIIMLVIIFELVFRIYNIWTRKKEKSDKYIRNDIIIHIFLLSALVLYEVIYIILQQNGII